MAGRHTAGARAPPTLNLGGGATRLVVQSCAWAVLVVTTSPVSQCPCHAQKYQLDGTSCGHPTERTLEEQTGASGQPQSYAQVCHRRRPLPLGVTQQPGIHSPHKKVVRAF